VAIKGSCLCGGVTFEIDAADGPFEICHCSRCRKVSGAGGMPGLAVAKEHFRLLDGRDLIHSWAAPILHEPPAYVVTFCARCGSPVPLPVDDFDFVEIPAGLFDDEPGIQPDKHIFVEYAPAWAPITDNLPTFTREEIRRHREG